MKSLFAVLSILFISSCSSGYAKKKTVASSVETLGKILLKAISTNNFNVAKKLLPTIGDLKKLGVKITTEKYKKFLKKRKRGFSRVVSKFERKRIKYKHRGVDCSKIKFSRVKKGKQKIRKGFKVISSIDLFGKCGKTEVWVADPDGIIKINKKFVLMEFN